MLFLLHQPVYVILLCKNSHPKPKLQSVPISLSFYHGGRNLHGFTFSPCFMMLIIGTSMSHLGRSICMYSLLEKVQLSVLSILLVKFFGLTLRYNLVPGFVLIGLRSPRTTNQNTNMESLHFRSSACSVHIRVYCIVCI